MHHIRTLIALAVLTGLGYAGNVLNLPVAFSVAFLFGSIFVIIAVSLFGPLLGGISALIASSYTVILWNHPYAIIIFVCEAIWVGFFLKRKKTNIVLIDAAYWLIIGLPLVFIFYFGVMSLGFQSASIIFMKQSINGIVNALIAAILITYLPLTKWVGIKSERRNVTYSQVIFQLTSAFLMLPILGMLLFTNYHESKTIQTITGELLVAESQEADELIEIWLERHTVAIKTITKLGRENNFQPSAKTQASLEQITLLFPDFHTVFIANNKATTVAFSPAVNEKGEKTIGMNFADREYFKQMKSTLKPVVSDVFQGRGGVFSPIFTISVPVVEAGKLTGFGLGAINLDKMRDLLARCSHNNSIVFTVVDQHNNTICSTNPNRTSLTPLKQKTEGQTLLIGNNFSLWTPSTKKNISVMDAWKDATYFVTLPIDGTTWKLITEVPIAPFQAYIYQETIVNLILIFCLFIASIIVSQIVSKRLARTPVKLAAISRDIPEKLEKNIEMNWPESNIEEMQHLIENFKQSTKELSLQYNNVKDSNILLEEKVQQRTTELRENDDALKQTRQNYEAFFNTIDEFLFVLDEQGNIIHTNSTVINRLGYTTEELFGLSVLMVHPPERREEAGRIVGEMLNGTAEFCPVPIVTKSGVQIPVETRVSHGLWNGKPVIFGVTKDISQVRLSEEKFSKVFYINPSICGLSDLDTGKYIEVNESFCTLIGFDKNEVIGKSATELGILTPEAKNTVLLKSDINGNVTNAETDLKAKNGGILHVLLSSENIFVQDKKYRFTVAHDITAQKNAEAEKENLESQNRQLQKTESLSRMAAAIAHHFNNQLGVVIGNLEMAIDEQPKVAPPTRSLASAMQAAWKAADMSRLMLTYLGQSRDKVLPLDLSSTCHEILPMLKAAMPGNVILEIHLSSPGPVIDTSPDYVQQILTNLSTNAWESIGKSSGTISLNVKTIPPSEIPAKNRFPVDFQLPDNSCACLEVADTGCGIAADDIEQLFDPFYSTKFTGRGMGLAVVLGLVKAHNGVVTVDSKPDSGSTFRVFFPLSEEALPQSQTAATKDDSLISKVSPGKTEKGGTVLLVEDEEPLRKMIFLMLDHLGFSALEAKDGIEALEVFGNHQSEIKFVLTDLTMPRMDGWETLTALRKLDSGIPVILASGYDLAHVMAGDHPERPQAFLAKPFNLKALSNAITQALGKKG